MPSPEATRRVAGGPSGASDHRKIGAHVSSTPAGVAYQIPSSVNSLRDRCRGRRKSTQLMTGGRSLRSDHRLPYEPPPVALCRFAAAVQDPTGICARARCSADVYYAAGVHDGMSLSQMAVEPSDQSSRDVPLMFLLGDAVAFVGIDDELG